MESCLIRRNHGALLAWKMLNFPRKLTDLSLPGFPKDFQFFMLIPFLNFVLHMCHGECALAITHLLSRVDSFHVGTEFPKHEDDRFIRENGTQDAVLVDYYK
ncbi:ADQ_G0006550.mRNA.1.CDS.1 [Saccharomyces cerevisiae]|nr:ADQ_G0006550.mRNA.1.CDS.1 [Saccharomyces cerevisiae]CAI6526485.1 ADQ_G0006550.mRNA.1.CDS.1 [Saccharomyces cerevisiae]